MKNGYIKLFRSIRDWYGYESSARVHLWIELLLLASHKNRKTIFDGSPITLKPGQLITKRCVLSASTRLSESYVEKLLKEFENNGQLEQLASNRSRLITILMWDGYQLSDNQEDNQEDN
jgi:hypothetical protein